MGVGLTAWVILVEQVGRAVLGGQVNFRMLGVAARAASFGTIGMMAGASLGLAQWLVLQRERVESCGRFGLGVAIGGCSRGKVGFRGQDRDHACSRQHTRGRMHCKGAG